MSLELNKCPICLRTAVDYRHLELITRFNSLLNLPRCQLCFGIPPSHETPEYRTAREEIKNLIDLVDFHLERTDRTYYDPVNWRAITFAFQIHQNRFQPQKPFILSDKFGFPQMDAVRLQEILAQIEQSKIFLLQDVQDEIKLVLQHQQIEIRLISNELNYQDLPYFLKCGFTKEELLQQLQSQVQQKIEAAPGSMEKKSMQKQINESKSEQKESKSKPALNIEKKIVDNSPNQRITRSNKKSIENTPSLSISNVKKQLQKQLKEDKQIKCSSSKRLRLPKKRFSQVKRNNSRPKISRIPKEKSKTMKNFMKREKKLMRKQILQIEALKKQYVKQNDKLNDSQNEQFKHQEKYQVQNEENIQRENYQKPTVTYSRDYNQNQLFGTPQKCPKQINLSDEIIFIQSLNPRKIIVDSSDVKVEQLIRSLDSALSKPSQIESDKLQNYLRLLQYLK